MELPVGHRAADTAKCIKRATHLLRKLLFNVLRGILVGSGYASPS